MLEREIDKALTNTICGNMSIQPPKIIDEKKLYGC